MGLAVGMGVEWLPNGRALGSCPLQWIARCPLVGGLVCPQAGLCLWLVTQARTLSWGLDIPLSTTK